MPGGYMMAPVKPVGPRKPTVTTKSTMKPLYWTRIQVKLSKHLIFLRI
jgi:hypothetical protein